MPEDRHRNDSLFRREALDKLLRVEDPREPLRVSPPWTWQLFWLLAVACAAALALAVLGKVEVQHPGRGILRPASGVRLVQTELAGILVQAPFRSGDHVLAGQSIARIQAAQVAGSLLETDRQLESLQSSGQRFSASEEQLTHSQLESIRARILNQETQIKSHQSSIDLQRTKVYANEKLLAAGLVSAINLGEARDGLNVITRQRDTALQQLAQLQQERAGLELTRKRQNYQRAETMKGALAKREALGLTQAQTELQAPISGYLEAMVARPGDLLQAGQPVAKLIPDASPMVGVAFLEEKDRASVKVGDSTQLELEAYPPSEFGTLRGRILRISSDLASPYEVREALGEEAKLEAPAYRVDIEILPIRPKRLKGLPLHAGALFQARFILRRQRIIALVLEPLRRWLE